MPDINIEIETKITMRTDRLDIFMSNCFSKEKESSEERQRIIGTIDKDDFYIFERYIFSRDTTEDIARHFDKTTHSIRASVDTIKRAVLNINHNKFKSSDDNLVLFKLYRLRLLTRFFDSPFANKNQ